MPEKIVAEKPEINVLAEIHNGAAHVVFSAQGGMYTALASKTNDRSRWCKAANVQEQADILRIRRSRNGFRVLIKNSRGQWNDYPTFEAFSKSQENWRCTGTRQAKYHPPVRLAVAIK